MGVKRRRPGLLISLVPILFLITSVYIGVFKYKQDIHILLLTSSAVAAIIAIYHGMTWKELEDSIIESIKISMPSMLILSVIGIIIGTWILSGTVPTIIYYGLSIISPKYFLVTTVLICVIITMAVGSSWTAISTVGVALMGIGVGLGIPKAMIVGAIITGAFFSNKMSPLSDVANLVPAIGDTTVFDYIKHSLYTAVPALGISIVIFYVIGVKNFANGSIDSSNISIILTTLEGNFIISPINLIPVICVFAMALKKFPPLPTLFIGGVLGGILAMIYQGADIGRVIGSAHYGYISNTGVDMIDTLLSRGGYDSMFWVISLIMAAMIFGGIIEASSMLDVISSRIINKVNSVGSLTVATIITSLFIVVTVGNTYLSMILPGKMFRQEYDKRNLSGKQLTRTVTDLASLLPPLIPWADSGAFIYATLGVSAFKYIPYCYLCFLTPVFAIVFGFTNRFIDYKNEEQRQDIS